MVHIETINKQFVVKYQVGDIINNLGPFRRKKTAIEVMNKLNLKISGKK